MGTGAPPTTAAQHIYYIQSCIGRATTNQLALRPTFVEYCSAARFREALHLDLYLHTLKDTSFDIFAADIPPSEETVCGSELERLECVPDLLDLVRGQGNHVGDGPHERVRVHALVRSWRRE